MFASRAFQLLILAVAVLSIAQGTWWDENRIPRRALSRRQDDDPATTPSSAPSESSDDDDASNQPTSVVTSEPPAEETTSQPPAETTTAPPAQETSDAPSSSSAEPPSTTNESPSRTTSEAPEETTSAPDRTSGTQEAPETTSTSSSASEQEEDKEKDKTSESLILSTIIDVVTRTNSDGSKSTFTSAVETSTTLPDLNEDNDGGSSGMSTKTRNTIIGVVVGIGGAIILGALGLVAWRIWGRKKQAEENDGLMAYEGGYTGPVEKSEPSSSPSASTSQRNPFQSTLENYHQPTPVNASSNF